MNYSLRGYVRDGNYEAAFAINGQMVPGRGGFFRMAVTSGCSRCLSPTAVSGAKGFGYSGSGVRYLKERNCVFAVMIPDSGFDVKRAVQETSWGKAIIEYPDFEEAPSLLVETLNWGDLPPDEIAEEIIGRIIEAL